MVSDPERASAVTALRHATARSTVNDEALMSAIAQGELGAFRALYDRLAPRVFGLALQITGAHRDAEDVTQETFMHVWRNAGRYDPALASPAAWTLLIARSRAVDAVRREHVRRPGLAGRNGHGAEEPAVPADSSFGARAAGWSESSGEGAEPIRRALAALPPDQAELIQLSFFFGCTHAQIAASTALPVGTVKTRIRLGMKRLREVLEEPHEVMPR
jgi:RNA polymerase sigma-70 factor (ECF subfamily)